MAFVHDPECSLKMGCSHCYGQQVYVFYVPLKKALIDEVNPPGSEYKKAVIGSSWPRPTQVQENHLYEALSRTLRM